MQSGHVYQLIQGLFGQPSFLEKNNLTWSTKLLLSSNDGIKP